MAYRGEIDEGGAIQLPVRVTAPEGNRDFRTNALVDTGAYWCGIRADVVEDLGLVQQGVTDRDTASGVRQAPFYIIHAEVRGVFEGLLNAALMSSVNHRFILGRRFLLGLKLTADRKGHMFTVEPA